MRLLLWGTVGSLAFILLNSELKGSVWYCPWSQPAIRLALDLQPDRDLGTSVGSGVMGGL